MNLKRDICIVGCGVAGLSALRVFSEEISGFSNNYSIFAYERDCKLGGVWNYNEDIESEFVSPMYRDLRTNLPKELMAYPDLFYPSDITESFIHHRDVLDYIRNYAKHYDLEKFIEFNSDVVSIDPVTSDDIVKWKLKIKTNEKIFEKLFDIVLLCNGHFEIPNIPLIKGIESFKGETIHSKHYRFPEKYANKTVFVLGAKSSGLDISLQLRGVAKKVYLSHNGNRSLGYLNKDNFEETGLISHIDSQGKICLTDGSQYEADIILFCTGYEIDFRLLGDYVGLQFDSMFVRPLYKDLIHPSFPNSFFVIGLAYEFIPFPHCYLQSKVARAIVENCQRNIEISSEKMLKEIQIEQENFERNNTPVRHRHVLGDKEWPYLEWCEDVAQSVITARIPQYYKNMFNVVKKCRLKDIDKYRGLVFQLVESCKLGFIISDGSDDVFVSKDLEYFLSSDMI